MQLIRRLCLIMLLSPIGITSIVIVLIYSVFITPIKSNFIFDFADWYSELF